MNLDEAIEMLEEIRLQHGGNTPLCIQTQETESVAVYEYAAIAKYHAIPVSGKDIKPHWVQVVTDQGKPVVVVF